jgi:hypothetical protein
VPAKEAAVDENIFNIQIRKFLKNVGVTSQREIEAAVREAVKKGRLKGNEKLKAKMTLAIEDVGLEKTIAGKISLE